MTDAKNLDQLYQEWDKSWREDVAKYGTPSVETDWKLRQLQTLRERLAND